METEQGDESLGGLKIAPQSIMYRWKRLCQCRRFQFLKRQMKERELGESTERRSRDTRRSTYSTW